MASLKFRHYATESALKGTNNTVQDALNAFDVGTIIFIDDTQKQYIITSKSNNVVTYKIYYGEAAVVGVSGSGATRTLTFSDGSEITVKINDVEHAISADTANTAKSIAWDNVTNKPNLVTTDTEQTIIGTKIFNNNTTFKNETDVESLMADSLLVTGSARFINTINGNLKGNVEGNLTGNASTATTAAICTGNSATATKIGTSTVGSATMPVYINSGTPTAISSFPEANLSWGGKNFSGSYGPIDAAMIPDLGACRSMFAEAAGITVQYSRDGGSTWVDYGCTDTQKTSLFSVGYPVRIGGPDTTTGIDRSTYLVRVILETKSAKVYTQLNKFAIYIGASGTTGNYCTIEARLRKNLDDEVDTWVNFADKVPINGWPVWNIINTPTITTYGNNPSLQYGEIRFTFGATSHPQTQYAGLYIERIYCFGGVGWSTPSNMAKHGHLYNYDVNQNATFPAAITSTMFKKSGGTSAQFLKADGSVDSSTYSKSGHTHTGSEVKLTGYSKASSYSAIAASDTVNQAIGKLEGAISGLENLLASI